MERKAVISNDLAIVGYDEAAKTLEVSFRNGKVYHYFDVPKHVYDELMSAASHGTYFNSNIKNAYKSEKIA
ncbi:MAG: KTSC domain-containing protein [Candidatus Omnitrophica bacterium]|nr:KTSC domain-containing protein [Candidatus Omnitrophota bacterium]